MHRRRIHGGTGIATVLIAAGLLVPAGATAAPARPDVTTGAAANVEQNSVTLRGGVTPNEAATTYYFEYGTTRNYTGSVPVPAASAGSGNRRSGRHRRRRRPRAGDDLPLPDRRPQRLGVRRGADRTFRTKRQPLGLTLAATPNPVAPGGRTTIAGALSGTGNGGRQIVLQSNPFPYTQGFQNASNVQLTNPDGTFAFPVLSVSINTQYRVQLPNQPQVQSPIATVGVAPTVSVKAKRVRRTARGAIYRFSGRITPEHDGAQIAIQRLKGTRWVTISGTIAKHRTSSYSRYRKSVRLRRGGRFRIFAGTNDGDHVQSVSRTVRLRIRR